MRRRSRATCHALCAALGTCVRTDGRTDGWIVCAVHNETVAARDERESRVFQLWDKNYCLDRNVTQSVTRGTCYIRV